MSAKVKATILAVLVASCFAPWWPAARSALSAQQSPGPPRDYPVQPVPFTAVHLDDVFWAPRIETNRTVSVPFAFEQCELSGRVENFIQAAKALRGEEIANKKLPGYPFDDTDIYKVIEGASYTLSVHPDPKLDAYVDSLIAKIGAAQEPDGYLYTARTIDPQHPHPWAGKDRWVLEKVDSHELYDLGHLYEAAVAHYQATGKRTLLDIALRSADLLTAHVRAREEVDLARAPDHRDGTGEAVPRHGPRAVPRPREIHARPARARREPGRGAHLQPVAGEDRRPDRGGRPRRSRHLHVLGHRRRRRAHRRRGLPEDVGHDLGQPGREEALHHRRHRRHRARRGVRRRLRDAEHDGLQRDVRRRRQRLLESPAVPAPRRLEVHRRDGAHPLQRPAVGRLARRQGVLLPEPARVGRPARAKPVVRRGVLPGQHHALHGVGAGLRLREERRHHLRQPVRGRLRRRPARRRPWHHSPPGHALPVGRKGAAHRHTRPPRGLHNRRAHPRLGAQRAGPERLVSIPRSR